MLGLFGWGAAFEHFLMSEPGPLNLTLGVLGAIALVLSIVWPDQMMKRD